MSVQIKERVMVLGTELGYTGAELREWVSKQVEVEEKKAAAEYEREERRLKREEQQRQIAAKAQEEMQA